MSIIRRTRFLPFFVALLAVSACASTTTAQLSPSPQSPVCSASATALVLWKPAWRADQKDVPSREAAAADGLGRFFETSECFKSASIERLSSTSEAAVGAAVTEGLKRNDKVVVITVRELGPIVIVGGSVALVEGGTEVVLDVAEFTTDLVGPRTFVVRWRDGGPGVIKGVASLPQDMQAALVAGLLPSAR